MQPTADCMLNWFLGTPEGKEKERWPNCGALRYDSYDRKGPKVFAGEYACHGTGKKWNHYETSLYEAAFMTGIERNADIVEMATYAPLFAHVEGWQWRPDMIWYDNTRMFKSVSYYVQQMYATNKGTHVLTLTTKDPADPKGKKNIPVAGTVACGVSGKKNQTVLNDRLPAMSFRLYKVRK